jgi:uncharacterized protein YfaS (alpha-2-macroglobulin family)
MKLLNLLSFVAVSAILASCGSGTNSSGKNSIPVDLPIDKGFSEYISAYTSGVIPANSAIEVHFTPGFASKATKSTSGLFSFDPSIKGKTEWKDDETLVFTPSKPLNSGTIYTGKLNLARIGEVKDRLGLFPLRFQTVKKDMRVSMGSLECTQGTENEYTLHGQVTVSDFIEPSEVERYVTVKLGRKRMNLEWDHSSELIHSFAVKGITRNSDDQKLKISWDAEHYGIEQEGSSEMIIPAAGEFRIIDVVAVSGESQKIDVVFSDPLDASQEITGLIHLSSQSEPTVNASSNIVSILPAKHLEGTVDLNVEPSIRNTKGVELDSPYSTQLDFTSVLPGIMAVGDGVILPSSENLIFPFKAANLKAVDLKIVKIFENNLPYFLQESDITGGYSMKRFGRPVYSGRVDLAITPGMNTSAWNLYTIDLSDYIEVEPGVLYKVSLGMRKEYSLYPCNGETEVGNYSELLRQAEEQSKAAWDDPENYYDDPIDMVYYSSDFDWDDRDNPCKNAYYGPNRRITRNVLASNLGLIAKMGDDKVLHVMVNDLISAMPVNEADIDIYDYQLQIMNTGKTNSEGSVALLCERKPFLVIAKKDKDRNYLKTNDGNALSLSSFDVAGNKPENGIKAFIYGERDVWRPGDSIFLSVFIKDMKSSLPADHPVQFELFNPMDQKVDNQIQKANGSNLLVFATATSSDAVTGNYRAVIRIGGANFTKRVRVETIKPNRLKINLSFPSEILGGSNRASKGSLNVKWLNGTVASDMQTSVEYILKHTKTEFEKYRQYNFDDPVRNFSSETVNIFNDKIDENGNASFVFNPGEDISAPGMLTAVFTAKTMEPGGDESIIQSSFKYAPYPVFAGINLPGLKGNERMLFTDRNNEVKIVTVNEKGQPVRSEVEVNIFKINYRWWWESDEENLGYYISNDNYKSVIKKNLTTSGGDASFSFKIDKNNWGRYLIRVTTPEGHSTGRIVLIDWPWDYGMKGKVDGATLLSVSTDKEKYNPGDEISLSFPSPENARAIVTLENSTGVLDEMRTSTGKGNTVVRFRAKPEMAPNVYAYVTIIQPHAQTVNDMPVRLYGIVPVMVEDPATRITPEISVPSEVRSQKPFIVRVSEKNKKSMTYTIAVVDEGLLDVTGFRTPDPWKYFYAREALGVQTWDLYDYVLGAFGGTLERILAIGGDEALVDKSANKAQRFIPAVKFLGPFNLSAGRTNTHNIVLPQYTGSVRTMVIAGNERAFGAAEQQVFVRDPLMLLVTAPRVVSPGEKVALPISLFINKEGLQEVTITAESNELISFEEHTRKVIAASTGEKETVLTFTSGEKTGVAKLNITATAGGETATYKMELEVRSPNPPETRSELKIVREGEKWQTEFSPFGIEGSNSAKLEISSLPSINLEKRLDYLLEYPHGCSEQITSMAFPQLFIRELKKDDESLIKEVPAHIREAVNVLASRQMSNGGITLWPGGPQPDNWVTSYAGHFIIEAEKLGYNIPSGLKRKWINYQTRLARDWKYDQRFRYSQNDQAYRLFTLALAGEPEKGAMNRLRESKDLPQLSRWLLAAAFATIGRPEAANGLLDMRNTKTETEYQNYYYGSEIRDKAIILYTLTLLKNEEQALPLLKEICEKFNNNDWYSTQSISWGLMSYLKWAQLLPDDGAPGKVTITVNGTNSVHTVTSKQVVTMEPQVKKGLNTIVMENTSSKPLYVTVTRKGIPLLSDKSFESKGLNMEVSYYGMDLKPLNHLELTQGTDFMATVRITNTTFSSIQNIALTQMVPSGWEIRNTRLFEADFGIKEGSYDYRDFRDDRVNTYFSLGQGESKTFVLILNAAYTGEFYQPSVFCEAMYTPNCYARVAGNKVKVITAGN